MSLNNFWQLLAGLGIFLYGMFQLEDSLKQLAGRTFKLFLKKHTDNKLSAIASGTIVTGVLQSSSVVTFIVLSFVGAGAISMRNALAVVLGANLGTTLDSWIVAALGFKFNIESFAFPVIVLAVIGLIIFSKNKKFYEASKFTMGFGLLFLGLSLMKESVEALVHTFNFAPYIHQNNLVFVCIGFIITAIIQSSSATMVITLTALSTGVIPFEAAVSVIIGSELGTSIKTVLASIGGIAAKKRVALGNIIFNIAITFFAFLFMHQIIKLIKGVIGINDPLIGLVLFQTIINLCGIILFFPFLNRFGDFLEKQFTEQDKSATYFIQDASSLVPEAALELLEKETLFFIHRVMRLNLQAFNIDDIILNNDSYFKSICETKENKLNSYSEKYDSLKHAEGEILILYSKMNEEQIEREDFIRLNQLVSAIKNAMYSAKGIKDIGHDRKELHESAVDIKFDQYKFQQEQLHNFYTKINNLIVMKEKSACFEELVRLMAQIRNDYDTRMNKIYKQSAKDNLKELDISTLLNVSREMYSSSKAIVFALKDYLLDATYAENFENIPVSVIK